MSNKVMIYASRLMTAREVHEACVRFREQEAAARRSQIRATNLAKKEA